MSHDKSKCLICEAVEFSRNPAIQFMLGANVNGVEVENFGQEMCFVLIFRAGMSNPNSEKSLCPKHHETLKIINMITKG